MKTSKVKSVTGSGMYKDFHSFEYTMEDGTILKANHKENAPRFPVGSVVDYEITFSNEYGNIGKLHKPQEGSPSYGGGASRSNDNKNGIKIGHAVTNAVSLVCANGRGEYFDIKEAVKAYAKMIYQISEELNEEL